MYPISTGALQPVLEDGEKLLLSLQDQHLPGSSCCSGWALLSPTTCTGDCRGGTVQQVCLHHMSHCRVSTFSPVPRVFLCFPTSLLSPTSCLWAQSRILTGILGWAAPAPPTVPLPVLKLAPVWRRSLLPLCTCSTNRDKLQSCCVWAVPLPFALSPTGCWHEAHWPSPLGQWHLCALRSGHSQGQCHFWVCQSQAVPAGVNRNICILQLISQFTK